MPKKERWGDTYFDRRNWPLYNDQLVKRGEFLIDADCVEN